MSARRFADANGDHLVHFLHRLLLNVRQERGFIRLTRDFVDSGLPSPMT
jgi:hypothetical protein